MRKKKKKSERLVIAVLASADRMSDTPRNIKVINFFPFPSQKMWGGGGGGGGGGGEGVLWIDVVPLVSGCCTLPGRVDRHRWSSSTLEMMLKTSMSNCKKPWTKHQRKISL